MIIGKVKTSELKEKMSLFKDGLANDLVEALQHSCPVDKGRLKASIKSHVYGNTIRISMVDYALHVEFGTAPHIIRPKNKKALHWGGKNGPVVKLVHHPGTQPQPFIRNTLRTKFKSLIRENLVRAFT